MGFSIGIFRFSKKVFRKKVMPICIRFYGKEEVYLHTSTLIGF